MKALIISKKETAKKKIGRFFRIVVGIYFTLFAGYFVFNEAMIDKYGIIFFAATIGMLLGFLLFLSNTLWASNRTLLKVDDLVIESKIPSNKLILEWVKVSRVSIEDNSILFFTDGERKQKELSFLNLPFDDVKNLKSKIIELCEHKNISCSQ